MNARRMLALGLWLGLLLGSAWLSLSGCGRFVEEDEKGNRKVREGSVEELKRTGRELRDAGREAKKDLEKAGREVRAAGRELEAAGRQAGAAAKKVGDALEPLTKELLGDAAITARVKAKLLADPEVKGSAIDVDTVDGKVTLRGKVSRRDAKAEAEKLARRTEGVVSVVNRLEVGGSR